MAGTKRTRKVLRELRLNNPAAGHIAPDETAIHSDEGRVLPSGDPLQEVPHDSGTLGTPGTESLSRPDHIRAGFRIGRQFRVKGSPKEIFTVTGMTDEGIDCTTSRFPGVDHRFPNASLRVYEIQFLPTESDYRRAADLAETAIRVSPQGSHVRFEEVQEQGVAA